MNAKDTQSQSADNEIDKPIISVIQTIAQGKFNNYKHFMNEIIVIYDVSIFLNFLLQKVLVQ